ncbi:MAG: hypothetical protein USCGTAYLOR_03042 [Chromatiales bacterium USCg_Taylor]|nr:MAG: hypothetical protein USCGTAYLOR_03042 [Chromatiales bacterium USCg_Taylor]
MVGAGDFPQGIMGIVDLIQSQDFLRHGQIVSGLGFLDVGDRDDPDLETKFGLVQLALEGTLCRTAEHELILGGKHIKIALAYPNPKVLPGCIDLGRSLLNAGAGLTQLHPAIIPKHGLGETERVRLARELEFPCAETFGVRFGGDIFEVPCDLGPEAE